MRGFDLGVGHAAMRARDVDLLLLDPAQCKQCRREDEGSDNEHRPRRKEMPGCAHGGGGKAVADRGKARIAAEPLTDVLVTDKPEADRRDRGPEHAACRRVQHRRRQHEGEDREARIDQRRAGDRDNRYSGDKTLGAGGIDEPAAGHLARERHEARH